MNGDRIVRYESGSDPLLAEIAYAIVSEVRARPLAAAAAAETLASSSPEDWFSKPCQIVTCSD